jgi:hypothetical protein
MHSALFVAKIPGLERHNWAGFLGAVAQHLRDEKSAMRLAENVWLVNFQASPSALSWLVTSAERHDTTYGILPFVDEPQWLPVGFDPNTIRGRNVGP